LDQQFHPHTSDDSRIIVEFLLLIYISTLPTIMPLAFLVFILAIAALALNFIAKSGGAGL
jgi:hypothetical protein